jgi:hypothetical protein
MVAHSRGLLRRLFLGRLELHLVLTLEDRTPLLVVCHRHATFDAYLDALFRLFGPSQQFIQKRHQASAFLDTFDGRKGFRVGPQDQIPGPQKAQRRRSVTTLQKLISSNSPS